MSNNGQTIADRLAAARHVIDGSTVNKAVVKATTHEIQGPKVKLGADGWIFEKMKIHVLNPKSGAGSLSVLGARPYRIF